MSKPKTIHTLESLKAKTAKEGDCLLWKGYFGNGVPMVFHDGKLLPVRKLFLQLLGIPVNLPYVCPKCGNPACVAPAHIVQRTEKTHTRNMAKQANTVHAESKRAALIVWRRANPIKLDMERANLIRADDRPYRQIAADFGISHSMVGKIKRGAYWRDTSSPFAGLFAANDSNRRAA